MVNFKYDLVTLFEFVEERPCLWNKKCKDYKNRRLREQSWVEICQLIDETYENQTIEERQKTEYIIQQKWINIKDAFIRSLKTKNGQTAKNRFERRSYLYADHLQFLLSCYDRNDTDSNVNQTSYSREESMDEEQSSELNVQTPDPPTPNVIKPFSGKKVSRPKRELDHFEREILQELKRSKASVTAESPLKQSVIAQNKDETFFTSYLPYITDMSEDEKLDLHMEILRSIKKIKQKRSNTFDSYA